MLKFVYALLGFSFLFSGVDLNAQSKQIVIVMGPPGSGKGTVAQKLSQELSIPHISTGDLFRENISQNTELGKNAKTYIDAGHLVPDSLVVDMLFDRVSQADAAHGYLLDGFPRTLPQADVFDAKLNPQDKLVVVNLNVSDEAIEKRAAARLSCPNCKAVYNTVIKPPKEEGKCDECGTLLTRRPDDQPAVVRERLRVYHRQTAPLVDHYTKKGVLRQINGEQSPVDVYKDVVKAVQGS